MRFILVSIFAWTISAFAYDLRPAAPSTPTPEQTVPALPTLPDLMQELRDIQEILDLSQMPKMPAPVESFPARVFSYPHVSTRARAVNQRYQRLPFFGTLAAAPVYALPPVQVEPASPSPTPETKETKDEPRAHIGNVLFVENTALGKIYTDARGKTLYTYTADPENESVCTDGCAVAWPPYLADETQTAEAPLSILTRTDGSKQWAYNSKPLYFFTGDGAPGETKGHAVNNVWFVILVEE